MDFKTSNSPMLLPCPNCGAEPAVIDRTGIFDCGLLVECPVCGMRTGEAAYYDETFPDELEAYPLMDREHVFERVAACWNMRTPLLTPPKQPRHYRRPQYVPVYRQRCLVQ